ncbi:3-hydroxyacyl-CoA dehydratase 2, partial [Tetrabaena socialis]
MDGAGRGQELVQGLSLLETAHAAVGLVPSSPVLALMQWAGRSNVLFLIVEPIDQLHASWWAVVLLACWAAAEVIRYPQYAMTVLGACPAWLTWLRYTMFIPLFPAGVVAEMALMAAALPTLAAGGRLSLALPNRLNWAFSYHRFIQ